jgi:thioredoxin-like negative regulator of GroEL
MEAGAEEAGAEDELELDEILAEISSIEETEEPGELAEGDLDEALAQDVAALASKYGKSFEKWIDSVGNKIHGGKGLGLTKGAFNESELEEAMETIATLRSEINEVNLLNAKLLYVNKLFKAKNLTESQKVKVINAFDRAESVKEAKNVYETLQESLSTAAKSQIKESLSFASKAAGVADRQPIVESNDFVARMQKLAGII